MQLFHPNLGIKAEKDCLRVWDVSDKTKMFRTFKNEDLLLFLSSAKIFCFFL